MRISCFGVKDSLCRPFSSCATGVGITIRSKPSRENAAFGHTRLFRATTHVAPPVRNQCVGSVKIFYRALLVSNNVKFNDRNQVAEERNSKSNNISSFVPPTVGIHRNNLENFPFVTANTHRVFPLRSMGSVPRKKAPRNSNKGGVKASKGAAVEVDSSSTEVQGVDLDDEEEEEEDEDEYLEDFEDEIEDEDDSIVENDAFIDDMLEEEGEGVDDIQLGDGGDGGGVRLSKTAWGQKALDIAKGVLEEFGSNFELYAFKVSPEGRVYVRLDKLSDKYGSPSVVEIESFSTIYGKRLEEAGQEGDIPNNLALEVSSPGAERVVEVPNQLLRFKDLPMFVKYVEANDPTDSGALAEKDGVLELESVEIEAGKTVWKIANVRFNRDQAGKGRGLTKKQKEWRAEVPLSSLRLVRLHMDI